MRRLMLLIAIAMTCATGSVAATHKITYLTGTTAYIDAGRDEGVVAGARIEVVRGGKVFTVLLVTDVSSHRAACAIASGVEGLTVGDAIRFKPAPVEPKQDPATRVFASGDSSAAGVPVVAKRSEPWPRRMGLRGRIGIRYLAVMDQSGLGGDVSQPSADVRLDGRGVGGSRFDLQVDVRARHTYQTVAGGEKYNDGEARVYRLNGAMRANGDRIRITMGRQFSSALTSVSTFDGVQTQYDRARWGVGAFAGTQPAPVDYSFSTDIREYGGYLQIRSRPLARTNWEISAAGIGSYQLNEINREYVSLVGRIGTARFSLFGQQDVDINRGWREQVENTGSSLTSTYVTGRYRITRDLDLDAGYDNRRNVRVYRDYVSPETEFDDSYRRGVWGGAGYRFLKRFRVGLSARSSSGGSAGDAISYVGTLSASRVTPAHLDFRVRSTRYDNERTEGWMHSVSGGIQVGPRWAMEIYGGVRDDRGKTSATPDVSTSWFGANVDLGLRESLYLNVSGEQNGSGLESYNQIYTSLSWRF